MIPADTYWQQISTQLQALETESVSHEQIEDWIRRWDSVLKSLDERYTHLKRAKYLDVQNTAADQAYNTFFDRMLATQQTARQMLGEKLLHLPDYTPPSQYTQFIRRLRTDRELYHPDNIPLQAEINALANTYRDLSWSIEKRADEAIAALAPSERSSAEHVEQLRAEQWLAERETLNQLSCHSVVKWHTTPGCRTTRHTGGASCTAWTTLPPTPHAFTRPLPTASYRVCARSSV